MLNAIVMITRYRRTGVFAETEMTMDWPGYANFREYWVEGVYHGKRIRPVTCPATR